MSLQTLNMSAIREELFLHYWLFGSDNVLKDMNDEFWHDELQLDQNNKTYEREERVERQEEVECPRKPIRCNVVTYINQKPDLNKVMLDNNNDNYVWIDRGGMQSYLLF